MNTLKTAFFALAFAGTLVACQTETEMEVEPMEDDAVVEPAPAVVDTMVMDTTVMLDTTAVPAAE